MLKVKATGNGSIKPIPADTHVGRCVGVYDLGTQYNERWKKHTRKCVLSFELPEVRSEFETEDGEKVNRPRVASKEYGLSLHKKANLRADLVSWRGRDFTPEEENGFDISKLLGQPAMVGITHKVTDKGTFSNVSSISKPHKSIDVPKQELVSRLFSFDEIDTYEAMMDILSEDGFPEWIRKKIESCKEYRALKERASLEIGEEVDSDEVPF